MFGKDKEKEADDDGPPSTPPQAFSSAAGPSTVPQNSSLTSTPERVRQIVRRPGIDTLRRPSVRIRRNPSNSSINQQPAPADNALHDIPEESSSRRRSTSEPQRPSWHGAPDAADRPGRMSTVDENSATVNSGPSRPRGSSLRAPRNMVEHLQPHLAPHLQSGDPEIAEQLAAHIDPHTEEAPPSRNIFSRMSNAARGRISRGTGDSEGGSVYLADGEDEYDSQMVDLLDVIDPEVSTLSTLTNVQNSLFVPNLGRLVNRRPTYNISRRSMLSDRMPGFEGQPEPKPEIEPEPEPESEAFRPTSSLESSVRPQLTHTSTISSTLSESRYAVLPHGESLAGWTPEEKAELNDMVRHMLHSKRAAFKRGMKGFGQYAKRPLGFFITLYAVLITLFGAAWVLFLIGWIGLGSKKDYIVNIVDNVLVALFAIMGDGLAPFRAVDTYHMIYIAHYHHLSWRLRREKHLPKLQNRNDLPLNRNDDQIDIENAAVGDSLERREHRGEWEYSVLSPEQQKKLQHHQAKFAASHTFYKPHETETHYAFPLRLLVTIVVLLDCHSLFQIALGTCTWAINYHHRPFALTTVILICSLTCNITGGILISVGDKRTRKKDVIEKMFRQELTHSAMKEVRKRRVKQNEETQDSDAEILPVHVPPPVKRKKEIEKEIKEREALEAAKITGGLAPHKTKNRWRDLPKLPWLTYKQHEEFDRKEAEQRAKEAEEEKRKKSSASGA